MSDALFTPRSVRWRSTELLDGLTRDDLRMPAELREDIASELWMNLRSEYDARHLSHFLRHSEIRLSPDFWQFESAWIYDEQNHYEGLCWLYASLYDLTTDEVNRRLGAAVPDFTQIAHLIRDEFTLCTILAYDELASARGYVQDFELYTRFGPAPLARWIRNAARDEVLHYRNACDLISLHHLDKVEAIPAVLEEVIAFDTSEVSQYRSTFLFDHAADPGHNPFDPAFMRDCGRMVCRHFGVRYSHKEREGAQ